MSAPRDEDRDPPLGDHCRISVRDDVIACDLGDEGVILDLTSGTYYGLDAVGRTVWEAIGSETTLGELCATLRRLYEVDEETCRRDVQALLRDLQAAGLVSVEEPSPRDEGA